MIGAKFLHSLFLILTLSEIDFHYDNTQDWVEKYPMCKGRKQSPIALFFLDSIPARLSPITFHDYELELQGPTEAVNNGHTVEVKVGPTIEGSRPAISGGGVGDIYEAQGFHFHWGSLNSGGSEHTISGKRFDLEVHIVHKNIRFSTMDEAINDPFGIAVVAILFKATRMRNIPQSGLNWIYDALPYLTKYESSVELNAALTLDSILGDLRTSQFFTYRGSLTTPPCAEAVTWFVFPDILPIEYKYLKRFWNLYDKRNLPLINNFRPLQARNNRRVYYRLSVD